jgi:predicted CXXCH cytochrome family protein
MKTYLKQGVICGCILAGAGILLLPSLAMAKATGPCVDCHTMHNSQDGAAMSGNGIANDVLLLNTCTACHTGTNDGSNNIPYVIDTSVSTYGTDTLAGGSFWWVSQTGGDAKGHNVVADLLVAEDGTLGNTPPGNGGTALATQLTCAGTMGCHGDRTIANNFGAISGAHHGDDSLMDGSSIANSYRFLEGVLGLEDADWEFTNSASDHNQYQGVARTAEDGALDATTISSLCAQCHQDFHNGAGSVEGSGGWGSPWVRHPTDFDMGDTAAGSEYRGYGGGIGTYMVEAPVASASLASVISTVTFADDTIVTCISCHRAHGSPNDDLLRWDYALMDAGNGSSGNVGCFQCHTTKDDA